MRSAKFHWCCLCALFLVLAGISAVTAVVDAGHSSLATPVTSGNEDHLVKQVVWKKCHRKLTPACLKLSLVRTVEMMSKDSSFVLVPGVTFSSNSTEVTTLPPELARSLSLDHPPIDELVSFSLGRYVRSLTLNVNLVDFFSGGNETIQNSVMDAFTGRGKGHGLGGYGALAAVLGGSLASMMLAALAAMSGKALMTSMAALMMAAMAAMKGGGGGGGEHKTYEVITKPIVSHYNTHSSEVQHEHGHHGHYRKRSLDRGVVEEGNKNLERAVVEEGKWGLEPYLVYSSHDANMGDDPYTMSQRDRKSLETAENIAQKPPVEAEKGYNDPEKDLSVETQVKEVPKESEAVKPTSIDEVSQKELLRRKRSVVEGGIFTSNEDALRGSKGNLFIVQKRFPRRIKEEEENVRSFYEHSHHNQPKNSMKLKRSVHQNIKNKHQYKDSSPNIKDKGQIREKRSVHEVLKPVYFDGHQETLENVQRSKRSVTAENLPDSKIININLHKIASSLGNAFKSNNVYKRLARNIPTKTLRFVR